MAKRQPSKLAKRVSKRASGYSYKLRELRKVVSGFDSKKLDDLYQSKPRTKAGKAARSKALNKVRSHFSRIRPFVHRSHKVVKVKNKAQLEELRKAVGLTKLKGLRAIPVPTGKPKQTRVKFDRHNRVTITVGKREEKLFRFPHIPFDADDAVAMVEAMLPSLPFGFYLFATRHAFLLTGIVERDQLPGELRALFYQYRSSPAFLKLLYGVKWLARSAETAMTRRKEARSERERAKGERKRVAHEKAARQLATMDKAFKKRRERISERARKTGRR